MLKRIFRFVALAVCALAVQAFAQSDLATVVGTVKDASSAVLPGVQVKVTNVGTNAEKTAVTNESGFYRVGQLPIGSYKVSFAKEGFKLLERKGLTLLISQVAEVNATLQVGGSTETIEVTGAPPILQTADSVISTNLNNEAVSELPLNVSGSRNLSNFMFAYVPGVEGSDYGSHINGGQAMTKEVLIDGTSAVSQLGGYISESQPPMESMQEYQVDTTGISADAGRSGGGVFKYEMKSGTNQIHGSLFGFMHSTALNALSASNRLSAVTDTANTAAYLRKTDSLSDWGGGFGGPIKKDKLFYYIAFERYMQSNWGLGANTRTVPTDAMMGLTSTGALATYADLSPMLSPGTPVMTYPMPGFPDGVPAMDNCGNPIYQGAIIDPSTVTGGNFGCVFVNNKIPTGRLSSVSKQILQLYHKYYQPESTLTTNEAGPAYSPDPWFHNTQTSIKADYLMSPRQHIAGSFYWDDYPRINADQGGVWSNNAQYGGPMANSYWHDTTAPSARLSDAIMISPTMVNTVYATFNRFHNPSNATSQPGKWDSQLGLLNGAGNFPLIYFESGMYTNGANYQNGWSFSPLGSQFNDDYAGNTFVYSDQLVWSRGRHNLKFGAEFRAMQFNYHTDVGTFMGGYPIIFDPTSTAGAWYDFNAYNMIGNAFGSFLLGQVYNAENSNPDNEYGRRKAFGAYVSDDFRMNSRVTINLSLRWDFNNPYKEKYGHWSNFDLTMKNPITGLMGGYEYLTSGSQSFEKRQDYYNYAPHVGVAYKINDKTVARANIGVFFAPLNLNTWGGIPYQQTGNPGFHAITQQGNFNWDNGYNPTTTPQSAYTAAYTQSGVVSIDPRALTPGNTQQYSVGVQRELDRVTKVDVNWIQSHSYHLQSGIFQHNQPKVVDMQNYILNNKQLPASYNGYYPSTQGPGWQGITPYPQAQVAYGPLYSVGVPLGNSDYKSLQITFTRRAAKGLSFLGSYNWSRTHGDVDTNFQELWGTGSLQNIYDLKNEAKNIAGFDMTHIVKGYVIYNLPFGHGQLLGSSVSPVVDQIISGWSLNGSFHYNTGTPISVHSTNSYYGFNSVYVNLVEGCKLTASGQRKLNGTWLNKSCFANPANAQLGTAGNYQEQVRNPGLATEDLGLHKSFATGPEKRYNLTLRIEFFNLFNRHQLGGPDTNLNDKDSAGNSLFGKITGYGGQGGRVGQFGARMTF